MFTPQQTDALKAPLGSSHVKTRKQAGRELSYVEGWWAIAEANRIFGFDNWSRETVDIKRLSEPYEKTNDYSKTNWHVAFMARVRVTVKAGDTLIVREGCGYGSGIDKDLGSAHESALKEAETDAMKRALMTFGNPFGLALYDKEQNGVIDDAKAAPTAKPSANKQPDPNRATAATQWANAAIVTVLNFTKSADLDAWHKKNHQTISDVRPLNEAAHKRLVDTLVKRKAELSPMNGG